MKTSRMIIRTTTVGLIVLTAACSGGDTAGPADNGDVAEVIVRLATATSYSLDGFEGPADSVALFADLRDSHAKAVGDRQVTWQVQLANGAQAGDSIASIVSTGTRTATLVFHQDVLVGVVASVLRTDGSSRSGTLYMIRSP